MTTLPSHVDAPAHVLLLLANDGAPGLSADALRARGTQVQP